jgi:hypothetical protein
MRRVTIDPSSRATDSADSQAVVLTICRYHASLKGCFLLLSSNLTTYNLPLRVPKFELKLEHFQRLQYELTIALTTLTTRTISDVRFPTSLTGDGSDAMYANDSALNRTHFYSFSVGISTVIIHLPTLSF